MVLQRNGLAHDDGRHEAGGHRVAKGRRRIVCKNDGENVATKSPAQLVKGRPSKNIRDGQGQSKI